MLNSEIAITFDEGRDEFRPYGLTCELWTPTLMRKADRHNEIEINYFTEGSITYLFQEKKITIPSRRLTVFWGLIPHQIIQYYGCSPYYVCTIPFSQFLQWKLPAKFIDRILNGEVLFESSEEFSKYDEFLLKNWINDIELSNSIDVIMLELQARLSRFANGEQPLKGSHNLSIYLRESSQVEKMAIYIAKNYQNQIKVSAIGVEVGLHPDYANSIFKKAFGCTLSEYVTEERIAHAQRKLVASNASITEIAFECGFNSISRFNAAFLKTNGCTPREFRKRFQ